MTRGRVIAVSKARLDRRTGLRDFINAAQEYLRFVQAKFGWKQNVVAWFPTNRAPVIGICVNVHFPQLDALLQLVSHDEGKTRFDQSLGGADATVA